MPDLAIDPSANEASRHRRLLDICRENDWFDYESENQPGYVDERTGVQYAGLSYSIVLPYGPKGTPKTLDAGEVDGFVWCWALQLGDDAVDKIRYRDGM